MNYTSSPTTPVKWPEDEKDPYEIAKKVLAERFKEIMETPSEAQELVG